MSDPSAALHRTAAAPDQQAASGLTTTMRRLQEIEKKTEIQTAVLATLDERLRGVLTITGEISQAIIGILEKLHEKGVRQYQAALDQLPQKIREVTGSDSLDRLADTIKAIEAPLAALQAAAESPEWMKKIQSMEERTGRLETMGNRQSAELADIKEKLQGNQKAIDGLYNVVIDIAEKIDREHDHLPA